MHRTGLDTYDVIPDAMKAYLRNYGYHFNKKACEYAVSMMRKRRDDDKQKTEKVTMKGKDEVEEMLKRFGVTLENNIMYDHVYVANMCYADFLTRSVPDDMHMALFIKDSVDDPDASDGQIFNRWYADMCHAGVPIEWEDLI